MSLWKEIRYMKTDALSFKRNVAHAIESLEPYHGKAISIPVPTNVTPRSVAEVYGFIRAYLYMQWDSNNTSFGNMPAVLSKSQVSNIKKLPWDTKIIAHMLRSRNDATTSLYEKIVRASWDLGAGPETAEEMVKLVIHGLENHFVVLPYDAKIEDNSIFDSEADYVASRVAKLKLNNCELVPTQLIAKNLNEKNLKYSEIDSVWRDYLRPNYTQYDYGTGFYNSDAGEGDKFNASLKRYSGVKRRIIATGLQIANITEDNSLFMDYVAKESEKGWGICRACNKKFALNPLKRMIGVPYRDVCKKDSYSYSRSTGFSHSSEGAQLSWEEHNSPDSAYRFMSKTELDHANAETLLFHRFESIEVMSDTEDPNVVKLRSVRNADPKKVLRVLDEMGYSISDTRYADDRETYIHNIAQLLANNYEVLLRLDRADMPISAHTKEAESRTYKSRILNEGTSLINGYSASVYFLGVTEERASKWRKNRSSRLVNNSQRVDGAIVGAINSLARM